MPVSRRITSAAIMSLAAVAGVAAPLQISRAAADERTGIGSGPSSLPATTFVAAPPNGAKGPDDITILASHEVDGGRPVIWTAYQNGIGADGSPAGAQSTVAGYDAHSGALVETIHVTGKVDGLTADRKLHQLIATVNEDDNSAFNLINVATRAVTTFRYSPDPAVSGNGGTDSIAVRGGKIFVTHSNPADTTQAAEYQVSLDYQTHVASLRPVFFDNSQARDAVTGATVTLGLTDPDTNAFIPGSAPRFGGALATVSQGDGQIVFARGLGKDQAHLSLLHLTDNVPGNVPPIDGLAVATANAGTLYVVDNAGGSITALDTTGWPAGTVFVGEPNDNGNPLLGTLDLSTGRITPLANTFANPKGLLFVSSPQDQN